MEMERADPTVSLPGKTGRSARLLLLRHGAAEGHEEGRFMGRTDAELLPCGERQMAEAAERARMWLEGANGMLIFSSPRKRARRSAEVFLDALGVAPDGSGPEVAEGLAEVDLGVESKHVVHAAGLRRLMGGFLPRLAWGRRRL